MFKTLNFRLRRHHQIQSARGAKQGGFLPRLHGGIFANRSDCHKNYNLDSKFRGYSERHIAIIFPGLWQHHCITIRFPSYRYHCGGDEVKRSAFLVADQNPRDGARSIFSLSIAERCGDVRWICWSSDVCDILPYHDCINSIDHKLLGFGQTFPISHMTAIWIILPFLSHTS